MAAGIRGAREEGVVGFDRAGESSTGKDVKRENFSGSDYGQRDSDSKASRKETKIKSTSEHGVDLALSPKKAFSISLPRNLLRKSMTPILSMRRVRITKSSTGRFFVFLLKVAALEAVRRGSMTKCPQIWWGLQGISLFQAPPFSWFQRWAPVRHLVQGTESFSKPLFFLSIASAVAGVVEDAQQSSEPSLLDRVLASEAPRTARPEVQEPETRRTFTLNRLREELQKADIELPERIDDNELERFLVAADGKLHKFVRIVQKTVSWRQSFYFLSSQELKAWSQLVFWHGYDEKSRPTLVIRLGLAYTTLLPDDRPRFCQAVVSQVEYSMLHLVNGEDPRITVILDCHGTTAIGFPVQMMKSCSMLLQEHYPTRLAALFAVNLPPVVRVVANTVMQVVRPVTREKVKLLGDVFLSALSEHLGGTDNVLSSLGGSCHCLHCMADRRSDGVHRVSHSRNLVGYGQAETLSLELEDDEDESAYPEDEISNYQTYNSVLRVAIVGLLMLWVVIALVAGLQIPEILPT